VISKTAKQLYIRQEDNVSYIKPVFTVHNGKPGRPRKVPDISYLEEALSPKRRITLTKLAKILNMHRHTLTHYLKVNKVNYKFATLPDADLDKLVKVFRATNPDIGIRYLIAFLRRHGLRVQKSRVTASINRTDRLGRTLRTRTAIQRKKYKVSRPNALWHIDGHHKLILWGFVIHGIADGYDRTVSSFYSCILYKP
jgi:hypothetical protein